MFAASKTAAASTGTPPATTDPKFNYVSLLLNDTGTNGQQNNTFLDSSTNNFTITRNGTPTQGAVTPYWPDGQWSNYFNGSSYLTNASNAAFAMGTNDFTLECWYNPGVKTSLYPLIAGNHTTAWAADAWELCDRHASATTKFLFQAYNYSSSTPLLISTTTVVVGVWYHIAVTRSGSTWRLFVNGALEATTTASFSADGGSSHPFQIGRGDASSSALVGTVSNLRLVKGTAVYTSNFTPSTTPLTAVSGTSLLTCQSNRFKDNSSNNFAITVTGTPTVQAFEPFEPSASYSAATYGGSGYFNGSTDSINTPTSAAVLGTNNWTFECWVYLNAKPSFGQVLGMRKGVSTSADQYAPVVIAITSTGFALYSSSNSTSWDVANGVAFGGTASVSQWYHVAVVRNGSAIYGYVNGVQTTLVASTSANYTSTNSVFAGGAQASDRVNCYISNARIVNGTAVYTAAFTPPTAPVTAITNTSLLLNFTNAGIYDAATLNDLLTVGDAQVSTAVSKWGSSSIKFDGTGDYLQAPATSLYDFGIGDWTVECWFYINGNTGLNSGSLRDASLFALNSGGSSSGLTLTVKGDSTTTGTGIQLYKSTNTTVNINKTATIAQLTWHHVAVTKSANTIRIFLNGTQLGTSDSDSTIWGSSTLLGVVGRQGWPGYVQEFNGYIDDLRITKGYARYTASFTPPTAPFPTR